MTNAPGDAVKLKAAIGFFVCGLGNIAFFMTLRINRTLSLYGAFKTGAMCIGIYEVSGLTKAS
jgi:hypothetical protein